MKGKIIPKGRSEKGRKEGGKDGRWFEPRLRRNLEHREKREG